MDSNSNSRSMAVVPHSGYPLAPVIVDLSPGLTGADLVGLLRRNTWLIGACALVAAVLAYAYATTLPKTYMATSAFAVGGEHVSIPQLEGALQSGDTGDPMLQVRTEVQAVQARQLIIGLVDELHLDRDPEFNGALRPPTLYGEAMAKLKSFLPKSGAAPSAAAAAAAAQDGIVNAVSNALNITQDNKSLVLGVTFTSQNPQLAAAAANRIVADYLAEIAKRRASANIGANAAVTQRIAEVGDDIKKLEQQEKELRSSSGMVALRAGSIGQQQVEQLTIEESRISVERSQIEANLSRASAAASSGNADELASVLDSATISRLRDQEAEASGRVADLSAQFGPGYPDLQSAQAHLGAVRSQLSGEARRIVASLSTQLKAAQAHEADVKAQLGQARSSGATSQDVLAQLAQMDQDIASRRTLYGSLLQSAQQTMAQPHSDSLPDVRVLSNATVPGIPAHPNMKFAVGFGGLAGALLGCVIGLTRPVRQAKFKNETDVANLTGAVILSRLRGNSAQWDRLAISALAQSAYAEPLRAALALMRMIGKTSPPHVIALVGAQAGRQAAAIAVALGHLSASGGKSVLLVECNAGKGNFAKLLAKQKSSGKRTSDETSWRDDIVRDEASGLDILFDYFGGLDRGNRTVALENLLVEAKDDYDLVFVGAPKIGETDAMELASSCDATILVVDLTVASAVETRAATGHLAGFAQSRLGAIVLGRA